MRFAIFDIECTKLKADQGFLLCAGFLPCDGDTPTILTLDPKRMGTKRRDLDRFLASAIRDELAKYDGIITWNGKMFDIPFVRDRLRLTRQRGLTKRRFHLDAMYKARMGNSTLTSSRLDWVATQHRCPYKKTKLDLDKWNEAEAEALAHFKTGRRNYDYILEHNRLDLYVTRWVYNKFRDEFQVIQREA